MEFRLLKHEQVEREESDHQARLRQKAEAKRIFERLESIGQLELRKRPEAVAKHFEVPACVLAVWVWLLPKVVEETDRFGVFVCVGIITPHLIWWFGFVLRDLWRASRGDSWIFDLEDGQLERHGVAVISLAELNRVRVRVILTDDEEKPSTSYLECVSQRGKIIELDRYGSPDEHLEVGEQLAQFLQIPFGRS